MNLEALENSSPGHWIYDVNDQFKRHVYERSLRAFAAGDAARDAITTRAALESRQKLIRERFLADIGGLPSCESPLNVQTTGEVAGDGYRIEKLIFESRPKNYVTANLYIPGSLSGRTGAVLFVCGHAAEAKTYHQYQTCCQYFVQAGLVVLAIDPVGQGERLSYWDPNTSSTTVNWGTGEHDHAGAQCLPLGDAMARYFLHDIVRAVDLLQTRPEVDPKRIGITGNSGGGTQSSLAMLAEPRIAAAAPGTFIMNRRTYLLAGGAQDAEQIWPGFSAAGFDHEDIVLAMAPRPVCVLAVTSDFFPIEGTRETVARTKRFWELCGRAGDLELAEDFSTHAYTPALARAAAKFFCKHLRGAECNADKAKIKLFDHKTLWATRSGQVRGDFSDAVFVHASNVARVKELEAKRSAIPAEKRKQDALAWLRGRVFNERKPCELNPRYFAHHEAGELTVDGAMWWSQEGVFNVGYAFRSKALEGKKLPVTLAVWNGGQTALKPHWDWIEKECGSGRAVVVLSVTGVGPLKPTTSHQRDPEGHFELNHKLCTDLLFLGDNLALLRTYDVLRTLEMLQIWPNLDASQLHAFGSGSHALYVQLAAALDSRIRRVTIENGPPNFAAWVSTPHYEPRGSYQTLISGILQHGDLSDF
jgi:hypothetical protein